MSDSKSEAARLRWHYCPTDAFFKIVTSQNFWLTNIFYMNDSAEFIWAKEMAMDIVHSQVGELSDEEVDFGCHLFQMLSSDAFAHVYCGCFTHKADDLSQWRGYADSGRGVAIGLDLDRIREANSIYKLDEVEVIYNDADKYESIRTVIKSAVNRMVSPLDELPIPTAIDTYRLIALTAPRAKNQSFAAEQETRLILEPDLPEDQPHPMNVGLLPTPSPDFRCRGNILVPYIPITAHVTQSNVCS